MLRRIAMILLGVVLVAASAAAQTTTATVLGTVTDAQKAVLPGVVVTALNVDTGIEVVSTTDATGRFRLGALKPGTYDIRTELSGFSPKVRKGVTLFVGQEVSFDFELGVAAVEETVNVTGEAPVIEVTKSEVSNVIDRRQIRFPSALQPGLFGPDPADARRRQRSGRRDEQQRVEHLSGGRRQQRPGVHGR